MHLKVPIWRSPSSSVRNLHTDPVPPLTPFPQMKDGQAALKAYIDFLKAAATGK